MQSLRTSSNEPSNKQAAQQPSFKDGKWLIYNAKANAWFESTNRVTQYRALATRLEWITAHHYANWMNKTERRAKYKGAWGVVAAEKK